MNVCRYLKSCFSPFSKLSKHGLKIYPFATRSFGDEIGGTIGGDAQLLSFGFMIVFFYIQIMLGK